MAKSDAAVLLTHMAFARVLEPMPDESNLAEIARDALVDEQLLSLELLCLSTYVLGAIINRMRLEGFIKANVAKGLLEEIFRYIQFLFSKKDLQVHFPAGITKENAFEWLLARYERYCGPGWTARTSEQAVSEVTEIFCNFLSKSPERLQGLAYATIFVRGNTIGEWLQTVRISS